MKLVKISVGMFILSVSLTLLAQPKPSPATAPVAAAAPGSPENPVVVGREEQSLNEPPTLGEFLRPSMALGGGGGMITANRDTAGPVSVLCFKDPDQKALSETTEDLAVLAFLLSRNLEQAFAGDAND